MSTQPSIPQATPFPPGPPYGPNGWQLVEPAAALYVTRDDRLYLRSRNSVAGLSLSLRARFQDPDGQVLPQSFDRVPASDRSADFITFDMGEGYLLGLAVTAGAAVVRRGQCYVEVGIIRGGTTGGTIVQRLLSGYVTTSSEVAWPAVDPPGHLDGAGALRSVLGTDPGAGVEVSEAVPTDSRWRVRSFRVQLVTSATVANRRVHLIIDDGANILLDLAAGDTQAASLTRNYNFAPDGFARVAQDNEIYVPIPPDLWLPQAARLRTSTTAIDAGDNFGPPRYLVEEHTED